MHLTNTFNIFPIYQPIHKEQGIGKEPGSFDGLLCSPISYTLFTIDIHIIFKNSLRECGNILLVFICFLDVTSQSGLDR